jgi:hypothetical protein
MCKNFDTNKEKRVELCYFDTPTQYSTSKYDNSLDSYYDLNMRLVMFN